MPTPPPPRFRLGAVEPAEAIAAFARRGLLQPSFRWQEVWEEEHASRFAVAGVAQLDVLRLFQDALREPLSQGKSLADFAKELKPKLVARGWWGNIEITDPTTGELRTTRFDDARLQLIYDVNLRQSYAAGRWAHIERNQARMPLVMYRTMRDERVRASHAQWDGLALPVDHPFWRQHYPPNGWRCRCTAFALSERDLRRRQQRGERIRTEAPPPTMVQYRDPRSGATTSGPLGVDPGFAYNPGDVPPAQHGAGLLRQALDGADPSIARAKVQQDLRGDNFARFLRQPTPQEEFPVAMLSASQARALGVLGENGRALMVTGEVASRQAARGLAAASYSWIQIALQSGTRLPDGTGAAWFLLDLASEAFVVVVRTVLGAGAQQDAPYVGTFELVPRDQADDNATVARLRRQAAGRR